jgi:hypothetical protein
MADIDELTYEGLQTKDNNTLVTDLVTGFQNIYAQNSEVLNLDSNTPDGQLIQLFAYAGTTIRELITEVYNSCDPDKCVGAVQDNRYQINYLERKTGSFTLQNITITTNQTVTLEGLDASFNDENASSFTVSDNNGNVWFLVDTTTLLAGSTTLEFRAKNKGAVIPTIGTITNLVTIIPGVISAINNVGATSIGVEEESDSDFRIRRARSVTMASGNNVDNIEARLLALDGVVDVNIHENRTNETDSTNTPAHTIWAIVEGGANTDIADIIYENIGGSDTRGSIEVPLTTASLQEITIRFDRETIIPLYIRFDILPITDMGEINLDAIKDYIAENLIFNIGEDVETSKVTQVCADALLSDGGNGYAINVEVSNGGTATPSTTSTTITSVSVVSSIFQDKVGDVTAIYEFEYSSDNWVFQGSNVDLDDYGISFVGTATDGDKIYIAFTAGTWSDYLPATSIADKYTTDANKIYISAAN